MSGAAAVLDALGDPTRRSIVEVLAGGPLPVGVLAGRLPISRPATSQHLRVLKAAGVVRGERHGREVVYRLVDEHLSHIVVDAVTHAEELA